MAKGRKAEKRAKEAGLIARLVHEFLDEYAPTHLTESAHTLKSYRDAASMYLAYLESRGVTPCSLSREHFGRDWVEGWLDWLGSERGNSNDTCNVRLASLRKLIEYMGTREPGMLYLHAEAKLVRRRTPDGKGVRSLSKEAVTALLAEPDTSTRMGRRDVTFLTLVYSTACRLDEARTLTAGKVHLDGPKPYITVLGKGGKPRSAYLLPKVTAMLRAYMREALGDDPDPSALLFPSPSTGGPLTERAWDKRIKRHARAAHEKCSAVPTDAAFHMLRHSKATHWVEGNELNIVEVQHLLGHEQLETTMVYVDVTGPQRLDALGTLEDESESSLGKKWKNRDGGLIGFCGLRGR